MDYFVAYCVVGIIVTVLGRWIVKNHSTDAGILRAIADDATNTVYAEEPIGRRFSSWSSKVMGTGIALAIGIIFWPILAVQLIRRLKRGESP